MKIEQFTITKKEIFLASSAIILLIVLILQIPIAIFNAYHLLLITVITFLAKGFMSDMRDTPVFYMFILGIIFTLYFPIFQVLLIYLIALVMFKVLKLA